MKTLRQSNSLASVDFRVDLKRLSVPTLILAGRFDRVALPRFSVQFKRYAPQAEFVMFEESGHHPYIEEPDRTFNAIREFLRK